MRPITIGNCPFPAILSSWGGAFNRGSLFIYPGLWLALYRGCINLFFLFFFFISFLFLFFFSFFIFFFIYFFFWISVLLFLIFFFHTTCSASNNTKFCTMVVASTEFSNSLVTSVMLCPAHR